MSVSPFNLLVALCSASFLLSKSLVVKGTLDPVLNDDPLLKSWDVCLNPDGFLKAPLLMGLFIFLSIITVFFLEFLMI